MGYRRPKCHQDFGFDGDKLSEHLTNNPSCNVEAYINTELWKVSVGIKKPKRSTRKEPQSSRSFSHISPNHQWIKQNIVTNDDGTYTMVCKRCGLKAKRIGNSIKFDMRFIHKIENCID